MIGQLVGNRYHILEKIGIGGMATVYKAEDAETGETVAVKMMFPHLTPDEELVGRFNRETDILAEMNHPNIVSFINSFREEGNYFIVMEYVDGGSLADFIPEAPLPPKRARQIAIQVCDALAVAHRHGVIHRDIKPSNILLTQAGQVKVADFGVAKMADKTKLTRTGSVIGSDAYMSPEAWVGEKLDARTDLYSLGVVLYEMLGGELPFPGPTPGAVMNQHLNQKPAPLRSLQKDVPPGLERVVQKALAKKPKARYQTARRMAADLETLPHPTLRGRVFRGRTPLVLVGGMLAVAVLLMGVGLLWNAFSKKAPSPIAAESTTQAVAVVPTATYTPKPSNTLLPTTTRQELGWEDIIHQTIGPMLSSTPLPTFTPTPIDTSTLTLSPTPELGIGSTQVSPVDGMTMVYVPAGEFRMGSEDGEDDESPVHSVYLDSYWIDQHEVTNAMFVELLNDLGNQIEGGATWLDVDHNDILIKQSGSQWQPKNGYDEHPVIEVTWYGARAYCEWAGRRLPTEAEWEKAARGIDGRTFPWGEGIGCELTNYWGKASGCIGFTNAVGSYPDGASPHGAWDMAGNVWEWVIDWYDSDYYEDSTFENPAGPDSGSHRVLRGGSFLDDIEGHLRTTVRGKYASSGAVRNLGFRCARSAP